MNEISILIDAIYSEKSIASKAEKAAKDRKTDASKAAASTVKAVAKFLTDTTDPRRFENLATGIIGGVAGVVATVLGGPVAGALAEVAASFIISHLYLDYKPTPYKVQDLTRNVTLNAEQQRLVTVVSNKQVGRTERSAGMR